MRRLAFAFLLLWSLPLSPRPASAYLMGPPPTLAQAAAQADLVVKARAISSRPVPDSWLGTLPGVTVEETRFQVISTVKGAQTPSVIAFRHYKKGPAFGRFMLMGPEPLGYEFTPGRAYLLFASAEKAHTYRQLWKTPPGYSSVSGVFLCADAHPAVSRDLRTLLWHELTGLLPSRSPQDQTYALGQLDTLSGGSFSPGGPTEYSRPRVLAAAAPLLAAPNADVTKTVLAMIAGHSQYLAEESGTHWTPRQYQAAETYSPAASAFAAQVFSQADKSANVGIRALAIRTLAVSGASEPGVLSAAARWASDPAPEVRSAAALLLAAGHGPDARAALEKLSRDATPAVRASAARGVEKSQNADALSLLEALLRDPDLSVREAAASALTSFPVAQTRTVLQAHLTDPEFRSIFVVTLAEEDARPYRAALTEVVQQSLIPPLFSGNLPDAVAWQLLFSLVGSQSRAALASGTWDAQMHALESGEVTSSSEPRDLYSFYLSHGLAGRARQFRLAARKAISFDMEPYFAEVDRQSAATH